MSEPRSLEPARPIFIVVQSAYPRELKEKVIEQQDLGYVCHGPVIMDLISSVFCQVMTSYTIPKDMLITTSFEKLGV